MQDDLISYFSNEPAIETNEIVSAKMGSKKRTGETFVKAALSDGRTFIKTLSRTGVQIDSTVTIPPYATREERDEIIFDLSKKYVQDDIADMLDISQGTVSNSLRRRKNIIK